MWFTRVSINNPVFATMVMVAIMVLGLFSYQRLSVEQMPDISIPVAVVRTPYPGASAEAVEQEVTRRIEEAVNTVSGIRTIRSGSRAGLLVGGGRVRAGRRHQDGDPGRARQGGRGAPRSSTATWASPPSRAPTTTTTSRSCISRCSSDARSLREVSDLAELLVVKRLQGAPGVGNIEVNGAVQRELAIHLKPEMMAAYGVGIDQIVAAIRVENQDAPAGVAGLRQDRARGARAGQDQERPRTSSASSSRAAARRRQHAAVTLGQLADVRDTQREETSLATVDGKRGISIQIRKTRGANTHRDGADAIRKQIAELKKSLPADVDAGDQLRPLEVHPRLAWTT